MANIKLLTDMCGPIQTNCYTLINEGTKEAVIIDAAGTPKSKDAEKLAENLKKAGAYLTAIFLTHGHYDHAGALDALRNIFKGVPVYIGKKDADMLKRPELNLSSWLIGEPVSIDFGSDESKEKGNNDKTVEDGEEISVLDTKVKCLLVPGHTSGSICYYFPEISSVFDGDTLFTGSVGRSDFPTGDGNLLIEKIREKLFSLPGDTKVFPGHGTETTIRCEKAGNFCFDGEME